MQKELNFIIIGAQKSGTTWLVDMLRYHPQVFIKREEVHYYDSNFEKGEDWYLSHFKEAEENQIIGEKTPDYFGLSHKVAPLIYNDFPKVKLILLLREPLERAISAYNHYVRIGKISPLASVNTYFRKALKGDDPLEILTYSNYQKNLSDFLKYFDSHQIFITTYEEMMDKKIDTLRAIEGFLDVDAFENYPIGLKSNAFKKSFLGLASNYYFPSLSPVFRRFDKFLPSYKQNPKREIYQNLSRFLKKSSDIHRQI